MAKKRLIAHKHSKRKITMGLKLEVMAASLHGISCNLLRVLSFSGHCNQSLCRQSYGVWLPTRFGHLSPEVEQHESWFLLVWSGKNQKDLNSLVKNKCGIVSESVQACGKSLGCYLALLFKPWHLGKEVLLYRRYHQRYHQKKWTVQNLNMLKILFNKH